MPTEQPEPRTFTSVLGDTLRVKGIGIEKLALLTGISERFLGLLAEGKYDKLPASPYTRGYLLKISEVLGIDGADLWKLFVAENEKTRKSMRKETVPANRFEGRRLGFRTLLLLLLGVLIVVFVGIRLISILGAPRLDLPGLGNRTVVETTSTLLIQGTVDPSAQLTVNGTAVYPQSNGGFQTELTLHPGSNTIEFRVKRFLGQEYTTTREVFYQAPSTSTTATSTINGA